MGIMKGQLWLSQLLEWQMIKMEKIGKRTIIDLAAGLTKEISIEFQIQLRSLCIFFLLLALR